MLGVASLNPDKYNMMARDMNGLADKYNISGTKMRLVVPRLTEIQLANIQNIATGEPSSNTPLPAPPPPPPEAVGAAVNVGGKTYDMGKLLAAVGERGDNMLAHIDPQLASLAENEGALPSPNINPMTGLPAYNGVGSAGDNTDTDDDDTMGWDAGIGGYGLGGTTSGMHDTGLDDDTDDDNPMGWDAGIGVSNPNFSGVASPADPGADYMAGVDAEGRTIAEFNERAAGIDVDAIMGWGMEDPTWGSRGPLTDAEMSPIDAGIAGLAGRDAAAAAAAADPAAA